MTDKMGLELKINQIEGNTIVVLKEMNMNEAEYYRQYLNETEDGLRLYGIRIEGYNICHVPYENLLYHTDSYGGFKLN